MLGEEGDLGAKGGKTAVGVDDVTDCRGKARRVADDLMARIDKFALASFRGQQAGEVQHAGPDHAGVAEQART